EAELRAAASGARARAVSASCSFAQRRLLRYGGRPVLGRRARVPVRDALPGRVELDLPAALGARSGGREARPGAIPRLRLRTPRARPGTPRLSLRALRIDRPQAPRREVRHPRGSPRRALAPEGLRRPLPRGPPGIEVVAAERFAQGSGDLLH